MASGVPSTRELVEALRGFLAEEVMPATEGRLSFMARVAANVAATVERELVLGPIRAARHQDRLSRLGVSTDSELAAAIRAGRLDGRRHELVDLVLTDVVEKLSISNPRYVEPQDTSALLRTTGSDPRAETRSTHPPTAHR